MAFMFHKQRNGHQSCISVMSDDNPCPRTLITLCQIPKALWRTLFRYVSHAFDSTNRRVFCWYSWKLKKKLNKRPKGTRKRGHEELQTTPVKNKGPDLGLLRAWVLVFSYNFLVFWFLFISHGTHSPCAFRASYYWFTVSALLLG